MQKLKSKINRFFYRNMDTGIPSLMLWIAIGNAVMLVLYLLNTGNPLFYQLFRFDRTMILQGQVWRLLTYPLVDLVEHVSRFLGEAIILAFGIWAERVLQRSWGVLKTNCYYLAGVLLTDVAAMLLGFNAGSYYLNVSLFLAVATMLPEEQIRLYFIIPIRMKWLAWVYFGLTLWELFTGVQSSLLQLFRGGAFSWSWAMPLIAFGNYALFFGRDMANVLPDFLRFHPKRKASARAGTHRGPIRVVPGGYRFRCTVCGRTDTEYPDLEFRYCSRCSGYRCYCIDHINNHTHITE